MSGSHWRNLAFASLVILATAVGAVIATSLQFEKNRAEAKQASAAYRYYAEIRPNCSILAIPAERAACVRDQEDAAYNEQYNQADLQAQKDMATWAFGVFWIGVLGFVSSAVGIVFLYLNLVGLDKQSGETRLIGEQQTKAYLAPVRCLLRWEETGHPKLRVTYRNGGQTPAIRVREVIAFERDENPPEWDQDMKGLPRPMIGGNSKVAFWTTVGWPDLSGSVREIEPEVVRIWAYVFYEDVFGCLYRSGAKFICDKGQIQKGMELDMTLDYPAFEPVFEEAPLHHQRSIEFDEFFRREPLLRRAGYRPPKPGASFKELKRRRDARRKMADKK